MRRRLLLALLSLTLAGAATAAWFHRSWLPVRLQETLRLRADVSEIRSRQAPVLASALAEQGLTLGAPVFLRIFKEEAELELYVQSGDIYRLFRTYPICNFSGDLGPKLKEGDRQSPEGFYTVTLAALNPASRYHLSFDLGFPNAYDRANGRTGSFLMVHGDCVSIGCYAMTDAAIEEIYLIVEAALTAGQPAVPVHTFPFRMHPDRLARSSDSPWFAFWSSLAPAYAAFETTGRPPPISIADTRYIIETPSR